MAKKRKKGKAEAERAVKEELAKKSPTEMEETKGWIRKDRPQDAVFPFTLKVGEFTLKGRLTGAAAQGIVPGMKPPPEPVNIKVGEFKLKGSLTGAAAQGIMPGMKPPPEPVKKAKKKKG